MLSLHHMPPLHAQTAACSNPLGTAAQQLTSSPLHLCFHQLRRRHVHLPCESIQTRGQLKGLPSMSACCRSACGLRHLLWPQGAAVLPITPGQRTHPQPAATTGRRTWPEASRSRSSASTSPITAGRQEVYKQEVYKQEVCKQEVCNQGGVTPHHSLRAMRPLHCVHMLACPPLQARALWRRSSTAQLARLSPVLWYLQTISSIVRSSASSTAGYFWAKRATPARGHKQGWLVLMACQ